MKSVKTGQCVRASGSSAGRVISTSGGSVKVKTASGSVRAYRASQLRPSKACARTSRQASESKFWSVSGSNNIVTGKTPASTWRGPFDSVAEAAAWNRTHGHAGKAQTLGGVRGGKHAPSRQDILDFIKDNDGATGRDVVMAFGVAANPVMDAMAGTSNIVYYDGGWHVGDPVSLPTLGGSNLREHQYEVVVGNVGTVYSGASKSAALASYDEYVKQSKSARGRAASETVVLMQNDEPIKEHVGSQDKNDEDLSGLRESLYEVYVGNIGNVYSGASKAEATAHYNEYKRQSQTGYGRAGGESVTMMRDDDMIKEHVGKQDEEDDDLSGPPPTGTVTPAKVWRHKSGRAASVRGASPWTSPHEKADWTMEDTGWTIQWPDGTSGTGRPPFATQEAAQAWVDAHPRFSGMSQG